MCAWGPDFAARNEVPAVVSIVYGVWYVIMNSKSGYITHLNDQMLVTPSPRSPSSPIVPVIVNQSVGVTMPSVAGPRTGTRAIIAEDHVTLALFLAGSRVKLLTQSFSWSKWLDRRLPQFVFRRTCSPPSRRITVLLLL